MSTHPPSTTPKYSRSEWLCESHINPKTGRKWDIGDTLICCCGEEVVVNQRGFAKLVSHQGSSKHRKKLRKKIMRNVEAEMWRLPLQEPQTATGHSNASPLKRALQDVDLDAKETLHDKPAYPSLSGLSVTSASTSQKENSRLSSLESELDAACAALNALKTAQGAHIDSDTYFAIARKEKQIRQLKSDIAVESIKAQRRKSQHQVYLHQMQRLAAQSRAAQSVSLATRPSSSEDFEMEDYPLAKPLYSTAAFFED